SPRHRYSHTSHGHHPPCTPDDGSPCRYHPAPASTATSATTTARRSPASEETTSSSSPDSAPPKSPDSSAAHCGPQCSTQPSPSPKTPPFSERSQHTYIPMVGRRAGISMTPVLPALTNENTGTGRSQ